MEILKNRVNSVIIYIVILQIKEVYKMATSYKKLWKLLIDKDLKKKDLAKLAEISNYTIGKLTRGDNVTTDVLVKSCKVLECDIGDIMEIIDTEK